MVMLIDDPTFLHSVLAVAPLEDEAVTVAFVMATEVLQRHARPLFLEVLRRERARGVITGPSLSHRLAVALAAHATELGARIDPRYQWAQTAWRAFEAGSAARSKA